MWSRGVLEDVEAIVFHLRDETHRLFEIVFTLAGEADDDVPGNRNILPRPANELDLLKVLFPSIASSHCPEDAIAARLGGQVYPLAEVRIFIDHFDHCAVEVPRIRGHKLDSRNPALSGNELEQLHEGRISGATQRFIDLIAVYSAAQTVAVDILSQEMDLLIATGGQSLRLFEDSLRRPAPLPSPGEGNDAKRT